MRFCEAKATETKVDSLARPHGAGANLKSNYASRFRELRQEYGQRTVIEWRIYAWQHQQVVSRFTLAYDHLLCIP